jgi:hypothetical protein
MLISAQSLGSDWPLAAGSVATGLSCFARLSPPPARPRDVIVIMIGAVNSTNRGSLDVSVVAVIGRGGQEYRCFSAPRGLLFTAIDAKLFQSRYNCALHLDTGTTCQSRWHSVRRREILLQCPCSQLNQRRTGKFRLSSAYRPEAFGLAFTGFPQPPGVARLPVLGTCAAASSGLASLAGSKRDDRYSMLEHQMCQRLAPEGT